MEKPYPCCACCPKVTCSAPVSQLSTGRMITDQDRTLILSRHENGETSKSIAKGLSLSLGQVRAVIAWTHPSLGGVAYRRKYLK
jgi:hypothetical protein